MSQHKTRLHYSPLYFYLEHIGLCSQAKDGTLSPEQTTVKVNCELRSHHCMQPRSPGHHSRS